MFVRLTAIVALVTLMILGANGHLPQWFGLQPINGQQAMLIGAPSSVDVKAVSGWAHATTAEEMCGFETTEAVTTLRSEGWKRDLTARRMIERVKRIAESKGQDVFCADVLAAYGPDGTELPGLVQPAG